MTSDVSPYLLIAAGGTGGHMFPAQALAEVMLRRGWTVALSTDARGARYTQGFAKAVVVHRVASDTFVQGDVLRRLVAPFRVMAGIAAMVAHVWRDRPSVVVGFGGYPSIPAVAAAWITRTPVMIHEQNGILGWVNKVFAKRVDVVACGTWPTILPRGVEAVHTGNPVRAAMLEKISTPYTPPGDWPMNLLIFGGSQGARVLADVVPKAILILPEGLRQHLRVAQQARPEDTARVLSAYRSLDIRAEVMPFFDDMPRRLSEAQLVISRAGASSLADIAVVGRPAILVPYPHAAGDHQTINSRIFVQAEAAISMPEDTLTPENLAHMMTTLLTQPQAAERMAQAAVTLGVPDAAQRLAVLVEELAKKGAKK